MKALVYKSTGSWYTVKDETGKFRNARIKGIFKIDGITSTNPISVGDEVIIEEEVESENSVIISDIFPRKNYINRQSPRHKHQQHIIAANVDQSVLVATLKEPKTSQGFIDRFLVACEMYHVPAVIVFNKADLYKSKENEKYSELKQMYEAIGYKVILMSVHDLKGIDKVRELLKDKISLLSGHSGVGKSSFINVICPENVLKTQDVSDWSGKGLHTTTFAEMYDLSPADNRDEGKIIDTPGMREFGMVNLSKQELSHYFPEMRDRLNDCQFNNCMHVNEMDCAIKKAIEKEEINIDRYISYLKILDTIDEKKY